MHIHSSQFIKGVIGTDPILEDGKPEFAFIGRSNVGKSSVINSLLESKTLVKSSSKPGKTQQINFFLINKDFYFVDLPGYGYAKMPPKDREKMRKRIIWYLAESGVTPKKVMLIIDMRVGLKEFDKQMIELLTEYKHDFIIVANKEDKLNQKERSKALKHIRENLSGVTVVTYSAKVGKKRHELFRAMWK